MINGLSTINVELTSRCQKKCHMCGRRAIEKEYPHLADWGDMDYELVESISKQVPDGIVVQFHDNGEPLLYPRLAEALSLFSGKIRCLDTNGKLLVDKAEEIIGNLETITLSVFQGDDEKEEQYDILKKFIEIKGNRKPWIVIRLLGDVDGDPYKELSANYNTAFPKFYTVARRILHSPKGSFKYERPPTVPEIGICLDLLHHLSIKRDGKVYPCVRFNYFKDRFDANLLGDLNNETLDEIWNGPSRKTLVDSHVKGFRNTIICEKCEYWGVPTS